MSHKSLYRTGLIFAILMSLSWIAYVFGSTGGTDTSGLGSAETVLALSSAWPSILGLWGGVLGSFFTIPAFLALGFYGGFIQMGMGIFFLAAMVLGARYSIIDGNAVKIVVVGAGIGGLSAAFWLTRRGHDVEVLEAAERPGGRMQLLERDADLDPLQIVLPGTNP